MEEITLHCRPSFRDNLNSSHDDSEPLQRNKEFYISFKIFYAQGRKTMGAMVKISSDIMARDF